jgi:tetratricopeptide (TPR) repeat protein
LSFFNVLAGGPRNGYRYLADSNLGWGSNLKPLKRWMDRRGVKEINLAYFGSADPEYYGIDATYLPGSATYLVDRITRPKLPGYVAISPTVLDGVYLARPWRIFYDGFRERQPVALVGNSIRVYWVEKWPDAASHVGNDPVDLTMLADSLLAGMDWPEHAIGYYRQALAGDPYNGVAWNSLGVALVKTGRMREAAESFARARDLRPQDDTPRQNLAAVLPYLNR